MSLSVKTQGWSTTLTTPVVGDPANQAHLHMQAKARDIGERFGEEHALNVDTTADGRHKAGAARAGFGTTANRPPQRSTTAQDGPSQATTGGNERGRFYYDETRFALQISTIVGALEVWQDVGAPQGTIAMWSGSVSLIPNGWFLCNGANGTPDLSGRFIVGYAAADADYSTIGNTGGNKTTTLTTTELPAHTHQATVAVGGSGIANNAVGGGNNANPQTVTTTSSGSGAAFSNRPPYFVLAFIQKS
jgi:microcystin-dependent protein